MQKSADAYRAPLAIVQSIGLIDTSIAWSGNSEVAKAYHASLATQSAPFVAKISEATAIAVPV